MPDEQSEKMLRLLEEIRDLTKERNDKLEAYINWSRQRHEEAVRRQKEWMESVSARRRQFLWTLVPLVLVAIGILLYVGFVVIPGSERSDTEHWLEQMRMIQTNQARSPR